MEENWKDINGYEGRYQISDLGRVRSFAHDKINGRLLSMRANKQGYYYVSLAKHCVMKSFKIHRLVAKAFIPNPNNYLCVDHIDRDKSNNKPDNLRWCTLSDNQHNENTLRHRQENSPRGSRHVKSQAVEQRTLDGQLIRTYGSINEAAKATGLVSSTIRVRCYRTNNVWGGYRWSFNNPEHVSEVTSKASSYKKSVIRISQNGEIKVYSSISEASKDSKVRASLITNCLHGRTHSAGGYYWKFETL